MILRPLTIPGSGGMSNSAAAPYHFTYAHRRSRFPVHRRGLTRHVSDVQADVRFALRPRADGARRRSVESLPAGELVAGGERSELPRVAPVTAVLLPGE